MTPESLKAEIERKLKEELGEQSSIRTAEYSQFKKDLTPKHHDWYERAAQFAGKALKIKPGGDSEKKLIEQLETAHLVITPTDAQSLTLFAPFTVFISLIIATVFIPYAFTQTLSIWFFLFSTVCALLVYVAFNGMPAFLSQRWKQRASNQMVLCVFYLVTYMRHTPNLELALEFAADHIGAPLSLDLKKVLWDVETERFKTVEESLEHYLVRWRNDAREFIEAVHLIESSLFENTNDRRLASLDKSLEVMLEETYEKMLHYAQDLKSPMTMLHMMGIILPILGLVILPLGVSFFTVHWTSISSFYNVLLPVLVYFLGIKILSTRPTGYGQTDLSLYSSQLKSLPGLKGQAIAMGAAMVLVGISPVIIHLVAPGFDIPLGEAFQLLGYTDDGQGPFGLGAGLLSLFVVLGIGLSVGIYYKKKAAAAVEVRNRTRQLEQEFASALFQLGNRIGDGLPIEIAFGKVSTTMEGTTAGGFYAMVANNITRLGMGVEQAIFDPKNGALTQYPSNLIESSMKVLVESSRKGPREASKALMSMSAYIKEMHRVDERLKDLLSDVLSSMKSQVNFLLPTIAGIVIGITSMITTVLGAINQQAQQFEASGLGSAFNNIPFGLGIPAFYFQIVVGIYVLEVTFILASLINGVENGVDPLQEMWIRGKSLVTSTGLYVGIAFVVMMVFNLIAGSILPALGTMG